MDIGFLLTRFEDRSHYLVRVDLAVEVKRLHVGEGFGEGAFCIKRIGHPDFFERVHLVLLVKLEPHHHVFKFLLGDRRFHLLDAGAKDLNETILTNLILKN